MILGNYFGKFVNMIMIVTKNGQREVYIRLFGFGVGDDYQQKPNCRTLSFVYQGTLPPKAQFFSLLSETGLY